MIKASEILFKLNDIFKDVLISFIPLLSDSIVEICEQYLILLDKSNNKENNYIEYPLLYNSFIFRIFFFRIEKLISNKIFLNEKENLLSIYKVILTLDKLSKNYFTNEYIDMNNIIEIKNNSIKIRENYRDNNNDSFSYNIDVNGSDIIFYIDYISIKNSDDNYINLIIEDNFGLKEFRIKKGSIYLYQKVKHINISYNNLGDELSDNFVIKIIPLKDEYKYNSFIKNENYVIISLIQKVVIHYLLFLFEDIHSQIDNFNNDKKEKNKSKIYQTELFKFISIPENENIIIGDKENNINKFINKLDKIFDDNNNFNILNNEISDLFNIINKYMNSKELMLLEKYEKNIKKINTNAFKNKIINDLEYEKKINELSQIFKYDLENKNAMMNKIKSNEDLDKLISKIFLFGIKYYNCFEKLTLFMKEVQKYNKEDWKIKIDEIKTIKNYSLFYSFYETSSKMKLIYHKHKSNFNDSNFENEVKEYFDELSKNINFLYNIIVPSDDNSLQPNISIINLLLDLIENNNIKIDEIKQYSKLQTFVAKIKLIELSIINSLLFSLNNCDNIIFLLYLVSKKIRNKYNKLNSFFDNIYGADYFLMEKLKYKFHLFLQILSNKNNNNEQNNSIIYQIAVIENLIWKIRGRNFPVLLDILKIFEEIKSPYKETKGVFKLENKNIYNLKYYNKTKLLEIKKEIFQFLVYQILDKINDILKYENDNDIDLSIERNPSKISETVYNELFKIIISYFVEIEPESLYYYELNLFFYEIFIKSKTLLQLLLNLSPNALIKIMKIAFYDELIYDNDKFDDKKYFRNKLIMIKLFYQIIEYINDDYDLLIQCIQKIDKEKNIIIENPFIYLYEKIMEKIKNNNEQKIINIYYIKLLLLCFDKILKIEKNRSQNIIKELIKNNINSIIILLNDDKSFICENRFVLQSKFQYNFEEQSLFNSPDKKDIIKGEIICFMQYNLNKNLKKKYDYEEDDSENNDLQFQRYYKDAEINYFDESLFSYDERNINNKFNKALVILNDDIYQEINSLQNIKIVDISDIFLLDNNNNYQELFIKNNLELILEIIKEEINKNETDEIMMFSLLNIIKKLIKHLDKDNILFFFRFIWEFYNKNKLEENNWIFMSKE